MSETEKLRAELLETASWLDERGQVIELFAESELKGFGEKLAGRRRRLREEAARFRGRAGLIRVVVDQAKES